MPTIPLIFNRQPIQGQQYPLAGPEVYGAGIGQELQYAGQVFERIQAGADHAEAIKLVGEGTAGLKDALMQADINNEDPEQYQEAVKNGIQSTYDSVLERATSPRVRRYVEAELSNNRIQAETRAKYDYFTKKRERGLGDLAVSADTLARAAAEAPDDITRESHYRTFGNLVGTMAGSGFISAKDKQMAMLKFDSQVLNKQATAQILSNPAGFLAQVQDRGSPYYRLGEDKVLELSEKARTSMERDERRQERIGKEITERVEQAWYSALGTGVLPSSEIEAAIRNENPWITPQKALQFKKLKDEGSGGSKEPVTAIMSSYYVTGRNMAAINRTRRELANLQARDGPNDFINKALNELQSDQTTLENQGISREANAIARDNRTISNLQNDLEANRENLPPALKSILGNTATQDKAKVKDIYLKEGEDAARKFVQEKTKQQKTQADKIPDPAKKVIDLTR